MKKDNKIIIRIDSETKKRFIEICKTEKITVSDSINNFIEKKIYDYSDKIAKESCWEKIDKQMKENRVITIDNIDILSDAYHSGRKKEIGDTVLYGYLVTKKTEDELEFGLISFHADELEAVYDFDLTNHLSVSNSNLVCLKNKSL